MSNNNDFDKTTMLATMEANCNNFNKTMNKEIKKRLLQSAIIICPLALGIGGWLIFKNPLFIAGGSATTVVGISAYQIAESIRHYKEMKTGIRSSNILDAFDDDEDSKVGLNLGNSNKLLSINPEIKKDTTIPQNKINLANKDLIVDKLNDEITSYARKHQQQIIYLDDDAWNSLLTALYGLFVDSNQEEKCSSAMLDWVQVALAKLENNCSANIDVKYFVNNVEYLSRYNIDRIKLSRIREYIFSTFFKINEASNDNVDKNRKGL